jgi:hypothetical protein
VVVWALANSYLTRNIIVCEEAKKKQNTFKKVIAIYFIPDILDLWHRNVLCLFLNVGGVFLGGRPHAFLFDEVVESLRFSFCDLRFSSSRRQGEGATSSPV